MDLLKTLQERGFIHQVTKEEELKKLIESKSISAYIGFDATADSLHVGSLLQIMVLRWLKEFGHEAIALLGEATTLIGDPSGKDQTRKMLDHRSIMSNASKIQTVIARCIPNARFVTNRDWLARMNFIEVLRDVGPHFTINRMMSFESVKNRIQREQGLTFLEFNYMLLQAMDFNHLFKVFDCQLQIGGSDQWGNICCGIDLIKKKQGKTAFGLTTPLIETANGKKMGKTEKGAIWLSENKTPVFDFWQFWRNTDDRDVERFLKLFTMLPIDQIKQLGTLQGKDINKAKIILATEVTKFVHGEEKALNAEKKAESIFIQKETKEIPVVRINSFETNIIDLVFELKLSESKSKARRLIEGGGLKINGIKVLDPKSNISELIEGDEFVISRKKKSIKIKRTNNA